MRYKSSGEREADQVLNVVEDAPGQGAYSAVADKFGKQAMVEVWHRDETSGLLRPAEIAGGAKPCKRQAGDQD